MAALFFSEMRYDPKHPRDANADRFVLSKVWQKNDIEII
jgi:transketolase N-terminal domain/subunit